MTPPTPPGTNAVVPPPPTPSAAGAVDLDLDLGAPAPQATHPSALPVGFVLKEYRIDSVLGTGGFGITYLAFDAHLQCQVAIKEYLPGEWATRAEGQQVVPRSSEHADDYREGLSSFLAETRVLASFRHPHIVRVNRFFEAHGTAYMVMDYEQGQSLRQWVKTPAARDEATLRRMFAGLLDGMEQIHNAGMVHRDIKPSNIYVRDSDSSLVLLDFGAARQASSEAAAEGVTSMVSPGFAPFEQYHARGVQGPWSDLYALGGVLYWLVTGHKPLEAPSRVKDDGLPPAAEVAAGRYGDEFLHMIDWALAVDEKDRPQSVAAFRPVFLRQAPAPRRARPARVHTSGRDGDTVRLPDQPTATSPPAVRPAYGPLLWVAAGIAVAAVLGYAAWNHGSRSTSSSAAKPVTPPLAATPSRSTAPQSTTETGNKDRAPAPAKSESQRSFACSELPFALRVTCTIEGKDVIRKCAPDLKNWNHDRPGCNRQGGTSRNHP